MESRTVDVELLIRMFLAGAKRLETKKEWINDMNVFPVPDGDTGINMTMTILSAARLVTELSDPTMEELAKAIASGSLRGARGNSGVILSQLLRGFTSVIATSEQLDIPTFCAAFEAACEAAYKAVLHPKEGTILTVAKDATAKALSLKEQPECSLDTFFSEILRAAEVSLEHTPELLPVLKEAGVLDSGGQGLVEVLRGAYAAFCGEEADVSFEEALTDAGITRISPQVEQEITFGYCTEFLIILKESFTQEQEQTYREFLNHVGDSIVLVTDDTIVKTHVHTNDPGLVLQRALSYGALSHIKIDNMREEHQEKLIKDAARLAKEQATQMDTAKDTEKEIGFIAVSMGEGLAEVFANLGVDRFVEGGQTMNPSTEDILHAIAMVNARTVFLFPNNKNILLAANQAAAMTKNKDVIVIPTTTVPQGITAMINYVPEAGAKSNAEMMMDVISTVKTGQVTYAVRETSLNGKHIYEGDYMGLGEGQILSAGTDLAVVTEEMVDALIDEESSFLCIYYGEDVSEEDARALGQVISNAYPECEVEVQFGGQPIYYYIISVE